MVFLHCVSQKSLGSRTSVHGTLVCFDLKFLLVRLKFPSLSCAMVVISTYINYLTTQLFEIDTIWTHLWTRISIFNKVDVSWLLIVPCSCIFLIDTVHFVCMSSPSVSECMRAYSWVFALISHWAVIWIARAQMHTRTHTLTHTNTVLLTSFGFDKRADFGATGVSVSVCSPNPREIHNTCTDLNDS